MSLSYDTLISRRADDWTSAYTTQQIQLYNISVGMGREGIEKEFPYLLDAPVPLGVPTYATLLSGGGAKAIAGAGLNVTKILHGEERLKVHRPLPPSAELVSSSWVSEIVDKGPDKGTIITVTTEGRLASGEALYTSEHVIFARGDGGLGGSS